MGDGSGGEARVGEGEEHHVIISSIASSTLILTRHISQSHHSAT